MNNTIKQKNIICNCQNEIQIFDQKLMYFENFEILECYKHFKDRFNERVGYWEVWICYLRGNCISINKQKMNRLIGNYIKD